MHCPQSEFARVLKNYFDKLKLSNIFMINTIYCIVVREML